MSAEETIASEVVAASLGGAISASILYPLEVLKTKMQAQATTDDEEADEDEKNGSSMIPFALNLYKKEGYSVFLHGMETSAFQSALEKALYFFAYTALKDGYYLLTNQKNLDTVANLALGCAAEWAHLPITLPVDAWTTRIQTNKSKETPMKILLSMLSDKDCNFYKGISAYYLLCFKPALQYTVYEQVKKTVLEQRRRLSGNRKSTTALSSAESFLLGMVARTIATVLVFPFLRAKVLLQTQEKSKTSCSVDGKSNNPTTTSVLLQEWKRSGLAGLYQGVGPELTRGIFSAALMLMIKERLAEVVRIFLLPKPRKNLN